MDNDQNRIKDFNAETKTLMIFRFLTGDASCKYWDEHVSVEGIDSCELKDFCDYLEDSIISYCDAGLDEDTEYRDIIKDNLDATGYKWEFVNDRPIYCNRVRILEL